MSDVRTLVDEWLAGLVDRWETGVRLSPIDFAKLDDMPPLPGGVSIDEFIIGVRDRINPPRLAPVIEVQSEGDEPGELPTSGDIISGARVHPELFFQLVEDIQEGYFDITLGPWDDYLDGMTGEGKLGDGPFNRETPGEDNTVVAQIVRENGEWQWAVFSSNDHDNPTGKWPVIIEVSLPGAELDEVQRDCDKWLLENGYYLVEPTCPIPEDCDIYENYS